MMAETRRPYLAYLLRLWQASTEQGTMWRASVESPHTAERRAFADLNQLFAFLEQRAGEEARAYEASSVEQEKGYGGAFDAGGLESSSSRPRNASQKAKERNP